MARKNAKKDKGAAVVAKRERRAAAKSAPEEEEWKPEPTGTYGWILKLFAVVAAVGLTYYFRQLDIAANAETDYISRKAVTAHRRFDVPCYLTEDSDDLVPGCHLVGDKCGRAVRDNFVTPEEVVQLREIAEIGMANRSDLGGPTIMDVNTGYVKDSDGLVNIYQPDRTSPPIPRFTAEQFALYRR
ncbi:hypothetical protein BBJ28_00006463 [Nothophytophthora sp. Chile5]|nr:hypothetical protein BBJ28_00006463 [Nothophytophthora sp. Chile5]